jgi:hypothetical protein
MTMDNDPQALDALDRALLGLPLEEPPAGLRSSILRATAYRPSPALSFWELAALGVLGAVGVWLVLLIVLGGGSLFAHTLGTITSTVVTALSNAATATWLAAGAATAVWLSLFTVSQPARGLPHRSDRRGLR